MQRSSIVDLVLLNQALLAKAAALRARSIEVQCESLIVQFRWLLSHGEAPQWGAGCHRAAARYKKSPRKRGAGEQRAGVPPAGPMSIAMVQAGPARCQIEMKW